MNFYSFHIGDYLSATRHLSWVEDAAFRRLLDVYYTNEKPLPNDLRAVYRLVIASTDEQREAVETILNEFFEATPDGWVNHRADAEIEVMREKQQKQRDKANKRWHSQDKERGNASAMPRHSESDAVASKTDADAMPPIPIPIPIPIPKINTPPTPPRGLDAEAWDRWLIYRAEIKKPIKPASMAAAMRAMAALGAMQASAVEHSIAQGWTGLHAPKVNGHNGHHNGVKPPTAAERRVYEATPQIAAPHVKAWYASQQVEVIDVSARLG